MPIIEYGLGAWAIFLAVVAGFAIFWPKDHLAAFKEQCRKQGMDFRETQDALAIRYHFVRLRRITSELCHELNGAIEKQHFVEAIQREAATLHAVNGFEAAKSFTAWATSCPDTEILYPDAVEVHMRHVRSKLAKIEHPPHLVKQVRADMRAACKVVRR